MSGESGPAAAAAAPLRLAALWYSVGAGLLLAVAVLSLIPLPEVGVGDKLSHVATYFVLAGYFAVLARRRRSLLRVAVGIMLYGALIEIAQGLVDYRHGEWGDLLANAAGTVAGMLLHFTPLGGIVAWIDSSLARKLPR